MPCRALNPLQHGPLCVSYTDEEVNTWGIVYKKLQAKVLFPLYGPLFPRCDIFRRCSPVFSTHTYPSIYSHKIHDNGTGQTILLQRIPQTHRSNGTPLRWAHDTKLHTPPPPPPNHTTPHHIYTHILTHAPYRHPRHAHTHMHTHACRLRPRQYPTAK